MAARINELRQSRIDGKTAAQAVLQKHLDLATAEGRGFTDAEKVEQKAVTDKVVGVDELISAEEMRLELEKATASASPNIKVGKNRATDATWHTEADGPKEQAEAIGLGRWAQAVARASTGRGSDPRLIKAAALGMNESSGEAGGFAVPVEYSTDIEASMFKAGEILSRVDSRIVIGNAMTFTTMNETSRVDGSRQGGVLGYWLDEAAAKTPSQMSLARVEMKLRKVAALGYMTDELLEDAAALGQELQAAFREELTFQVENKIYRGLGGATPLGIMSSPALVTVAKEVGQAAATIVTENLSKMWARLPARSQANAVWLVNVDAQPSFDTLAFAVGTGVLEPRFVTYGPTGLMSIKGRPVIPVEYAESIGTVGDILLADLKQYRLIRKASGIQEASSIHVAFTTDQTVFRAVGRYDGQPMPRAAITPFKGTATLSPFVALATRA